MKKTIKTNALIDCERVSTGLFSEKKHMRIQRSTGVILGILIGSLLSWILDMKAPFGLYFVAGLLALGIAIISIIQLVSPKDGHSYILLDETEEEFTVDTEEWQVFWKTENEESADALPLYAGSFSAKKRQFRNAVRYELCGTPHTQFWRYISNRESELVYSVKKVTLQITFAPNDDSRKEVRCFLETLCEERKNERVATVFTA